MTPEQRKALRARAHALDPVVMISAAGLSPGVMNEIDRGLKSRELIKIRIFGADRDAREAMLGEICLRTAAHPVQHIGKIFVIYRERPEVDGATPEAVRPKQRLKERSPRLRKEAPRPGQRLQPVPGKRRRSPAKGTARR